MTSTIGEILPVAARRFGVEWRWWSAIGLGTAVMAARGPGDRGINFLPLPHTYGSCVFNAAVMAGSTLIMIPRFDAETVLRAIGEHRATLMDGVPTTYYYLAPRLDSAANGKRQTANTSARSDKTRAAGSYPPIRRLYMGVIRGLGRAVGGLVLGVGGLLRGVVTGVARLFRRLV